MWTAWRISSRPGSLQPDWCAMPLDLMTRLDPLRTSGEREVAVQCVSYSASCAKHACDLDVRALAQEPNAASVEVIHGADQLHVALRRAGIAFLEAVEGLVRGIAWLASGGNDSRLLSVRPSAQ